MDYTSQRRIYLLGCRDTDTLVKVKKGLREQGKNQLQDIDKIGGETHSDPGHGDPQIFPCSCPLVNDGDDDGYYCKTTQSTRSQDSAGEPSLSTIRITPLSRPFYRWCI